MVMGIVSTKTPALEDEDELLDTQLLIYFVPFVYLFTSLIVLQRRDVGSGMMKAALIGGSGIAVTVFAMVIATIPPSGTAQPGLFFAKVVGGAAAFIALGGVLYFRAPAPQTSR